eukprot:762428-Pleurochrysis_carterae.AAC.1
MSLVPYDSDMDEENAAEAAAIAGALDSSSSSNEDEAGDGSHMQLRPESGSERESHGKSADEEETNADDAVAPPVPVALTGAGDDDDDDDDDERGGRADDPEEQPTLVLPPPDFSDWSADPAQMAAAARPAAPKVSVLGKQKRQGGPHQISRGFSAAVTRHDQLKAAAREEWERQQEVTATWRCAMRRRALTH